MRNYVIVRVWHSNALKILKEKDPKSTGHVSLEIYQEYTLHLRREKPEKDQPATISLYKESENYKAMITNSLDKAEEFNLSELFADQETNPVIHLPWNDLDTKEEDCLNLQEDESSTRAKEVINLIVLKCAHAQPLYISLWSSWNASDSTRSWELKNLNYDFEKLGSPDLMASLGQLNIEALLVEWRSIEVEHKNNPNRFGFDLFPSVPQVFRPVVNCASNIYHYFRPSQKNVTNTIAIKKRIECCSTLSLSLLETSGIYRHLRYRHWPVIQQSFHTSTYATVMSFFLVIIGQCFSLLKPSKKSLHDFQGGSPFGPMGLLAILPSFGLGLFSSIRSFYWYSNFSKLQESAEKNMLVRFGLPLSSALGLSSLLGFSLGFLWGGAKRLLLGYDPAIAITPSYVADLVVRAQEGEQTQRVLDDSKEGYFSRAIVKLTYQLTP